MSRIMQQFSITVEFKRRRDRRKDKISLSKSVSRIEFARAREIKSIQIFDSFLVAHSTPRPPKKHVTTFSTITLTISVRLQSFFA